MAKYIIDIPDEVPVSDELVPFDMCRPSWYWEAYKKGKADTEDNAWEFAMTCLKMDGADFYKCFGCSMVDCLTELSYHEAKAKFDAWKKEKKILVGDEVIYNSRTRAVVLKPETKERYGTILATSELATISASHDDLEKTGRHFPEVAQLLKKMREE